VVAHPKIAEVRGREGEIPTVIHQLRLVLLNIPCVQPIGRYAERNEFKDITALPTSQVFRKIQKFKTRVKNLKIEKIIAFDKYLHELFIAFYFHVNKNLFLTLKNNEVTDLTHFSTKRGCF